MGQIIDVEYREITGLEEKSTELLTAEANSLYSQAEAVANVSMGLLIQAGERLVAIKQRIDHGGWEDWCSENLAFSKSKAERMMRLAKKAREEGSIFSNPSTLTDIGISKVWALLSAPEEVAEEVVEETKNKEMSTKEFKIELDRVKAENEALKAASEDERERAASMQEHILELRTQLQEKEREAEAVPDTSELEAEKQALEEKLENAKQELKDYKKKVKAQQDVIRSNAEAKAKEEAQKEADQRVEQAIAEAVKDADGEIATLQKEVDRLQTIADPLLAEFKVKADALQKSFNSCLETIDRADEETKAKWKAVLAKVVESMKDQL